MQVDVIAHTVIDPEAMWKSVEYKFDPEDSNASDMDTLAEFAGRSCYLSWSKPNPATATNEGYHKNTLSQRHFSIYEHASITLYVQGVSRALTHELIRHRHLSYSQLSQRFVDESKREDDLVLPPAAEEDSFAESIHRAAHDQAHSLYRELVNHYQKNRGLPRKQAREAARAVLPNQQETKLAITSNLRGWREFVQKRNDPAADAEIRLLAQRVLAILREYAPNSVSDLDD